MKPFLIIFAFLLLITSCRKNDVQLIRGKLVKCDISEQSWGATGYLVGKGFKKTYYDNGFVETVTTKMNGAFSSYDSIVYSFTYSYGKANVTAHRWFFVPIGDGEGGIIIIPDPDRPPTEYSFVVEFDPKTLNAVTAGSTTFRYDKLGKLTGYDDFPIEYDNKGNIVVIHTELGGMIVFEYDYTRTAKQQLYYTTGFSTNEMFNLMEIMGWIPVEPNNLRTSHTIYPEADFLIGQFYFSDHVVDENGILISFNETDLPFPPITNTWNCQPILKKVR